MTKLTYKQQLELAREKAIEPFEVCIADEIDMISAGYTNEEFESVCALVRDTYMGTSEDNIYFLCKAIATLFSKYTLKEIWGMSAWERLDLYEEEF